MNRNRIIALSVLIMFISVINAQVRLTSVETSATKWDIPVAKRSIPGQTGKYFQTYMTLSNLMDSLGISGGGGTGLLGVDPRIPYFSSTTSLYHTTNLKWDTIIQALRVRNIPIGSNALEQLYAGQLAGTGATGATYSNFFGYQAGDGATNASYSNFFGINSGRTATDATYSNFFGYEAGNGATNSSYCNYFGREAGKNASSGQNNNYFGYQSGLNATSAVASNFFGANAGTSATSASYSNFFGTGAGTGATSATFSNFFGLDAGNGATGAQFSNFFGLNAGKTSTGGQFSNFFGNDAGNGATSASYSNFFGNTTGKNATAASFSNIFGFNSGTAFTGNNIGSNNIIIGTNISLPNTTADAINIGGVLFGTGTQNVTAGDPKIVATAGGKVGVMTVAPTQELHVTGNARITGAIYDSNNDPGTSGQVLSTTVTGTDWIAASSGGITNLGGQTGATQTFDVGLSGTYPSWSSAADVHTYRLPTASTNQVLKYDGTGWAAGTDAGLTAAITSISGQAGATQTLDIGSTGTDFNISSISGTHTFNIPSASASNRGLVTTGTQTFAGIKTFSFLGGAPVGGNSLIVADVNGTLDNLYGATTGHVPKWNGTAFTLQADAGITSAITSLGGQTGATQTFSVANSGTYPSWSSSSNIHTYRLPTASSGQVLKHDGIGWAAGTDNVNDADANATNEIQTLSFSSPNLSLSLGGGSVALPVLPAAVDHNTLRGLSPSSWIVSTFLKNNATTTASGNNKRVEINNDGAGETWPSSINTATKFLVNGKIQINSTSSTPCTTLMGQNGDMEVGDVTIGSGIDLISGAIQAEAINYAQIIRDGGFTITLPGTGSANATKIDFSTASSVTTYHTSSSINDEITINSGQPVGLYEISYNVSIQPGANNSEYTVAVFKNGSALAGTKSLVGLNSTSFLNTYIPASSSFITSLTGSDVMDLRIYTSNNTGVAYQHPNFSIKRIY